MDNSRADDGGAKSAEGVGGGNGGSKLDFSGRPWEAAAAEVDLSLAAKAGVSGEGNLIFQAACGNEKQRSETGKWRVGGNG